MVKIWNRNILKSKKKKNEQYSRLAKHALYAQQQGAVAVVIIVSTPGVETILIDGDYGEVDIPIYLIDLGGAMIAFEILQKNGNLSLPTTINLEPELNTLYSHMLSGRWIFFQILILTVNVFSFGFSARSIIISVQKGKFGNSLFFPLINLLSILFIM